MTFLEVLGYGGDTRRWLSTSRCHEIVVMSTENSDILDAHTAVQHEWNGLTV